MDIETILLFALTEFLLSLSPGPAVLLIVGLSMRIGFRAGFAAALGVIATNAVFFTLSALGVGALIVASATLFTILKWIGAAYLVYLGAGMIAPLLRKTPKPDAAALNLDKARAAAAGGRVSDLRAFWRGFALQASNPKNLAFFVAILPQFITPDEPVAIQMLILGVVSVALELPILIGYAAAFAFAASLINARMVQRIEALGGGVLIGLGATLASEDAVRR